MCASNERQLGLGFLQYIQDYDEQFPGAWGGNGSSATGVNQVGGWMFYSAYSNSASTANGFDPARGALYSCVKSTGVYVCPDDSLGQASHNSYAVNGCAMSSESSSSPGYFPGKALAAFDATSSWILLGEEAGTPSQDAGSTDDAYLALTNNLSTRHTMASNVAFVDGHVKWIRPERIEADHLRTGGVVPATAGACQ